MNGRVYDPEIGRFLSADPHVQFPELSQSYNRYSYTLNNPLKYSDPSGYFLEWLIALAVEYLFISTTIELLVLEALVTAVVHGAAIGFALATGYSLANGVPLGRALKAGLQGALWGALTAGVTWGIGHGLGINWGHYGAVPKAIAHGTAQGLLSVARGGKFEHSFLAGAFGSLAGSYAGGLIEDTPLDSDWGTGLISAVVGGTASELGGGKFANGAVSAAFVYLYNHRFGFGHEHDREDPSDAYTARQPADGRLWDVRYRGVCAEGATICPPPQDLMDMNDPGTQRYWLAVRLEGLRQAEKVLGPGALLLRHPGVEVVDLTVGSAIKALEAELYGTPPGPDLLDRPDREEILLNPKGKR